MVTAVDSSVLLDVLTNDPNHGQASLRALDAARGLGRLVICPVVWAEVGAFFDQTDRMRLALNAAGITFDPFDEISASLAAHQWRKYRQGGGRRTRMIPDFLVAAHAQTRAAALLTRDRGFHRRYFETLRIVEPTGGRTRSVGPTEDDH